MIEGFVGFSNIPFKKVRMCEKFRLNGKWYQKFENEDGVVIACPLEPNSQSGEPVSLRVGDNIPLDTVVEAIWEPGR